MLHRAMSGSASIMRRGTSFTIGRRTSIWFFVPLLGVAVRDPRRHSVPSAAPMESRSPRWRRPRSTHCPPLRRAPVGAVLIALEAKACMTAHQRALPRLYDELNSSHLTVHGANDQATAAGFAMINIADRYRSPDLNKKNRAEDPVWSSHGQRGTRNWPWTRFGSCQGGRRQAIPATTPSPSSSSICLTTEVLQS